MVGNFIPQNGFGFLLGRLLIETSGSTIGIRP